MPGFLLTMTGLRRHADGTDSPGGVAFRQRPAGALLVIGVIGLPVKRALRRFYHLDVGCCPPGHGAVAGNPPVEFGMAMFAAFQKSLSFGTFSTNTVAQGDRRAVTAELFEAAGRGELRSVVHGVLPLRHAVLAHQKMAAGDVFGRIVLVP
ncbi:MAG: zinc-binding dehydrogenase [Devosia sp.]|nr:zinc-binding dehydrogenase [Devosia sp.]